MSNEVTIEQMNEVIARFDGWESRLQKKGQHSKTPLWYKVSAGYAAWDLTAMKYHTSWDWLMPVVEKIAALSLDDIVHIEIGKSYSRCFYWNIDDGKVHLFDKGQGTSIQVVYAAVYQFITWYNQQQQNDAA